MENSLRNTIIAAIISFAIVIGFVIYVRSNLLITDEPVRDMLINKDDLENIELTENVKFAYYMVKGSYIYSSCNEVVVMYDNSKTDIAQVNASAAICYAAQKVSSSSTDRKSLPITGTAENGTKYCQVDSDLTVYDYDNTGSCDVYSFSKNDLKEQFIQLFGSEPQNYENFIVNNVVKCDVVGDNYYCSEHDGENTKENLKNYYTYLKEFEENEDELIIYDYLIYNPDNTKKCYSGLSNTLVGDCPQNPTNSYIKNSGQLYKHVFKNNNGVHYWYSSEPIKK